MVQVTCPVTDLLLSVDILVNVLLLLKNLLYLGYPNNVDNVSQFGVLTNNIAAPIYNTL